MSASKVEKPLVILAAGEIESWRIRYDESRGFELCDDTGQVLPIRCMADVILARP